MSENRIIALGSDSALKKEAVEIALRKIGLRYEVHCFETSSGQNAQPCETGETLTGALTRAQAALESYPEAKAAVGIESGIFRITLDKPLTIDYAYIVILTNDGRRIISHSPAVPFPEAYVVIAEKRGFDTTTVGTVIAEKIGGQSNDPHSTVTDGRVSRVDTLVAGLEIALCQI